ncbi:helix-hairpin-helix domain-containing protein [Streptomyces chitinivorans]|uniref:helix-hairpin-helix domain-containing protein n=1 Tax=Streptomyces chitinivorans TaxID=1257027 RepID=UPI002448F505|nr:helix-hairpin-helix domain-containing protein [Streptomyces chitinivorans]MDH2411088.1 helix-hairpin-helix domain-containing protein [Streptomyces chitinivorans]
MAAVRAVESGERSAAEFFAEPRPAPRPRRAAPAARPGGGPVGPGGPRAAPGGGPVTVPEGVTALLAEGGAPAALGTAVVEAFGEGAEEVLRADPWELLAVPGVAPEQADGFARALLGPQGGPGDERRCRALAVWLLERAALSGHTVLDPGKLAEGLARYGVPDPETAVGEAVDAGAVLAFEDAGEEGAGAGEAGGGAGSTGADEEEEEGGRPVRLLIGLERHALAEESLAEGLARLSSTFTPPGEEEAARWEEAAGGAPGPSAAELVRAAARSGLVAHTGGEAARAEPAALVAAARALGLRAYAAAHSEDGRRRLAALLEAEGGGESGRGGDPGDGPDGDGPGPAAVTVDGLLAGREGPGRDEEGAYALDLLAVLDAPQLDAERAAMLVEAVPDGARLVLSGDPHLLGSAGAGQVLADLLAARVCPQVVSRTPDPGPVGELVSGIGIGELNQVEAPGREVVIVPVRDAGEAVHRTVQLVADSVPRALGVPAGLTQVITPGHGGAAGTRVLNAALKERLNPGPGRFGGFDPGDRVAHSPVPGHTALGTVVSGDEEGLRLDCSGRAVTVPRGQVARTVRHGWAITAHQATGTRWPAAVVVLPGDAVPALSRAWVYTAFGRGERHLSVVHGVDQALPRAVERIPAPERTTRLRTLLRAQAAQAAPPREAAG